MYFGAYGFLMNSFFRKYRKCVLKRHLGILISYAIILTLISGGNFISDEIAGINSLEPVWKFIVIWIVSSVLLLLIISIGLATDKNYVINEEEEV